MSKPKSTAGLDDISELEKEMLPTEGIVSVTIKGFPPGLLMNNPIGMMKDRGKSRRKTEIPSPEEEAEAKCYRDENGGLFVPMEAIYGSILNVAANYKIGKSRATSYIAGGVKVRPLRIPLNLTKYDIDIRPAVVQRQRVIRARAWIKDWKIHFYMIFEPSLGITPVLLNDCLVESGRRVGILDFRPQHRGPFGTFVVEDFKVLREGGKVAQD